MDSIFAAFLIGLVGSLHCVGMCGPIVLAVSGASKAKLGFITDNLLYNFGRIITYAVMGLILGFFGATVRLAGYQELASVVIGVAMLVVLVFPKKWLAPLQSSSVINSVISAFKKRFYAFMNWNSRISFLVIGLLNGLLPCGLVYVALAASITAGGVVEGALFMAAFGLGTIPLLFLTFSMRTILPVHWRHKVTKFIPIGIAIVAILLILRGLSLGIPYISPVLPDNVAPKMQTGCCHH